MGNGHLTKKKENSSYNPGLQIQTFLLFTFSQAQSLFSFQTYSLSALKKKKNLQRRITSSRDFFTWCSGSCLCKISVYHLCIHRSIQLIIYIFIQSFIRFFISLFVCLCVKSHSENLYISPLLCLWIWYPVHCLFSLFVCLLAYLKIPQLKTKAHFCLFLFVCLSDCLVNW